MKGYQENTENNYTPYHFRFEVHGNSSNGSNNSNGDRCLTLN